LAILANTARRFAELVGNLETVDIFIGGPFFQALSKRSKRAKKEESDLSLPSFLSPS
jgi:hypothetical protein